MSSSDNSDVVSSAPENDFAESYVTEKGQHVIGGLGSGTAPPFGMLQHHALPEMQLAGKLSRRGSQIIKVKRKTSREGASTSMSANFSASPSPIPQAHAQAGAQANAQANAQPRRADATPVARQAGASLEPSQLNSVVHVYRGEEIAPTANVARAPLYTAAPRESGAEPPSSKSTLRSAIGHFAQQISERMSRHAAPTAAANAKQTAAQLKLNREHAAAAERHKQALAKAGRKVLDPRFALDSAAMPEAGQFAGLAYGATASGNQTYHFIAPNEVEEARQHNLVQQMQNSNRQRLSEKLSRFAAPIARLSSQLSGAAPTKPENLVLNFQESDNLERFLDDAAEKPMVVEQPRARSLESVSDEEQPAGEVVKPSFVYAGAAVQPPMYAGNLRSKSMLLHACEFHQCVNVPNEQPPAFLAAHRPLAEALGAVPLPFDPVYTGMPAPVLDALRGGSEAFLQISPLVASWFDFETCVADAPAAT